MEVRALGLDHLDALRALGARDDVVRYGDHAADTDWTEWLGAADGNRRITVGAFEGDALRAAARLTFSARRRGLHATPLQLVVPFEGATDAADALVAALVECADGWLQIVRIAHRAPVDHPYVEAVFVPRGFAVEGTRRSSVTRDDELDDEVQLARVDARARVASGGPSFPIPPRRAPRAAIIRPIEPRDGPAVARLFSDTRVTWGTLQVPFQREETWTTRFEENDPDRVWTIAAELDGELAGTGAVLLGAARRSHVGSIGMAVAPKFQGCTVGRQLLDALIGQADARGLERLELEVWTDNERARRLYESRGFVLECVERATGYRDGAFASDLSMARLAPRG